MPHTDKLDSFTDEIRFLDSLVFGGADSQLQVPADELVRRMFPVLLKAFLDESRGKAKDEFLKLFVDLNKTKNSPFNKFFLLTVFCSITI